MVPFRNCRADRRGRLSTTSACCGRGRTDPARGKAAYLSAKAKTKATDEYLTEAMAKRSRAGPPDL
jgi:hypothetical protein